MPIFSFILVLFFIAIVVFGIFEVAVSTDLFGIGTDTAQPAIASQDSSGDATEKTKFLSIAGSVAIFCLFVCIHFVFNFFNVALSACVLGIFENKEIGLLGGISIAFQRLTAILSWSFITAIVGSIANTIERRGFGLASILTILAGLAWRMATFFVIPIIASKNAGSVSIIKRSVKLMRDVWGASVISNLGLKWIKLVFILIVFGGLLLTHLISGTQALIDMAAVVIPLGLIVVLLLSCIGTISRTALFYYATKKIVPLQFEADVLKNAIVEKRAKSL